MLSNGFNLCGRYNLVVVEFVAKYASDGTVFDSTRARKKPIAFVFGGRPFAGVTRGLMMGLEGMTPGQRRVVRVPSVGPLYKLNAVDQWLERAWFQPTTLTWFQTLLSNGFNLCRYTSELGFGRDGTVLVQASCDGPFCDKSLKDLPPTRVPPDADLVYEVGLYELNAVDP